MVTSINILFKINLGTQEHKCFLPPVADKNRIMFAQICFRYIWHIFPRLPLSWWLLFFSRKVADSHKYYFIQIREPVIAIAGVDLVWKREILQLSGTENEIISLLLWLSLTKPSAAGGAAWPSEIIWLPKCVWWLQTRAMAVPPQSWSLFLCQHRCPARRALPEQEFQHWFPFVKVVSFNSGPK